MTKTSPRGRMPGTGYDPVATRAGLTAAALSLFGRQGYHATSVQEIANKAGMTKGAFYHHFDSKEDLLRIIHDEFIDYQLEAVGQVLEGAHDPAEQLRLLIREVLVSVDRFRDNVTIFYQERRYLTGEHFDAVKAKRDQLEQHFQMVVDRGIESGQFRSDLDRRAVTLGVIGMCAWAYQWFQPTGPLTADEVAMNFASIVLNGLVV